jgi:phospholipid/cholesterol/gamma-HCH transport system substrate-binding protein
MLNRTTIDLWVGLFVTLGIAALFFLALSVGSASTSTRAADLYHVTAEFDNIGGLKARAPVKSAGVVVGRVESIRFDNNKYVAVVRLALDKQYQFTRDTSAEILTSGLLGEQYLGLSAGGEETMLKDGDRITLTSSAVVLEQLISKFMFNKAEDASKSPAPAN